MRLTGGLLLLLALSAQAEAGARVALPAGESPEAWASALSAAGLEIAAPGTRPDLALRVQGARWVVELDGAAPQRVMPPADAGARADLALLLASLAQPAGALDWGVVGPAPAPVVVEKAGQPLRTPVVTSVKAPVAILQKRPAPVNAAPVKAAPVEAAPVEAAPAAPPMIEPPSVLAETEVEVPTASAAPLAEPLASAPALSEGAPGPPEVFVDNLSDNLSISPRASRRPSAWIEAGAAAGFRPEVEIAPTFGLGAGIRLGDWRLGLRGSGGGSSALTALGEQRALQSDAGQVGAWWCGLPSFSLGGGAMLWRQRYLEADAPIDVARVPAIWLEPRVELPLVAGLRLGVGGQGAFDLRPTELWVGDARKAELSRWSMSAGVWILGRWGDQDSALPPPRQ